MSKTASLPKGSVKREHATSKEAFLKMQLGKGTADPYRVMETEESGNLRWCVTVNSSAISVTLVQF